MGDLTRNFNRSEFACKCECGFDDIDFGLVVKLQALVDELEEAHRARRVRCVVNSGCRCPEWNAKVGGASKSQHLKGTAADIVCDVYMDAQGEWDRIDPQEVALRCEKYFNEGGLGRYDTFTHVDVRGRKARW